MFDHRFRPSLTKYLYFFGVNAGQPIEHCRVEGFIEQGEIFKFHAMDPAKGVFRVDVVSSCRLGGKGDSVLVKLIGPGHLIWEVLALKDVTRPDALRVAVEVTSI